MQLAAEGCDTALINPRFTKPLDEGATEFFGRAADVVVTMEDHVLPGGYGSSVLEVFNEKQIQTPVVRIGWPDKFIEHASTADLSGFEPIWDELQALTETLAIAGTS